MSNGLYSVRTKGYERATPPESPVPSPAPAWFAKPRRRYHHGDLVASALARGREIVARHGPTALTLRGLARDLGVTAPALVHYFRSVDGLRAAVAESIMEQMRDAAGLSAPDFARPPDAARGWIGFAAANANLYRLASGEGWHGPAPRHGFHGSRATRSPRRLLEDSLRTTARASAGYLAVTIHGLALARVDGVPEPAVEAALKRALREP